MGIEKLKSSLLSEANEDAQKIIEAAEGHVKSMLEEERSKGTVLRKKAEKDVSNLLKAQRNERIAWARLESKRIIAEAKEDALENVLEQFFEELKNARKSPEYKKFMKAAVSDAVAELGKGAKIHLIRGDKKIITVPKGCKVSYDLPALGGVIVESADGKIRMDFTLETLFDIKRDEIRKQASEMLFGGKE